MTWLRIADRLRGAVAWQAWPEAPWLPRLIVLSDAARPAMRFPDSEPKRVAAYRDAEAPHAEQLAQAVEQFLKGYSLPVFAPPASYFLSLRFHVVSFLLESAFDGVLADPKPDQAAVVLRQLLIERWRDYGASWAIGFSYVEHDFDDEEH